MVQWGVEEERLTVSEMEGYEEGVSETKPQRSARGR